MNRAAVIIGVNKTGDLPVLNAAASGAREFAQWASTQGFDVNLLTDENGKSVGISDIKNAIRTFVQQGTFTQLVIFFSGHGILRGPDYELWLLSGAPSDPNEAVNVTGSIFLARNSGIPHIVVISDACRSLPNTPRLSQINGSVIFPNEPTRAKRPDIDVFYATIPGDPAMEAPAENTVGNYRGIFTECLLKGLSGKIPEVIERLEDVSTTRWIIPAWKLKPYLEQEVPEVVSLVAIQLQQEPEIRVESHLPKYLAEVSAPPIDPYFSASDGTRDSTTLTVNFKQLVKRFKQLDEYEDSDRIRELLDLAQDSGFLPAIERLLEARGRESFETRTGFTVIGAGVERAIVTGRLHCDLFQEANAYQIRVYEDNDFSQSKSILLQFAGGNGVALAVLPEFIGTVIVEDERVVNVNYTPSRNTSKYWDYQGTKTQIEQRRAFVAVAARNGSFRLEREQAEDVARYLRVLKSLDPTLGIYAAYAYAQSGALEGVKSVYRYMSYEREPVPFDVVLLAQELPDLRLLSHQHIAPFCPMLTQGWAFLEPYQETIPAAVRQAGQHLVPSLWTTFNSEGVDILWSSIEKGEIA
jgi:hypothetical protein